MTWIARRWDVLGTRLRPWLPDVRDLHVYGGALLIAWGISRYAPAMGWVVMGMVLLALGLRRAP